MADNSVRFDATLDDKVSSKLDHIRDRFDKLGGPGSSASLFGNVGAKAVAKGFSLIGAAADAAVNFLGDSIQAAIDNEASIQTLTTALHDNIPAWQGNTDAIEEKIAAQEKLGFSDDEQRHSLALLVGVTRDVTDAQDLQREAMDLARLKGIDLATATDALIKAHNGNYKALKLIGVEVDKNATATEALAQVQKIAAGQAEDYANTTAGKLAVAQTQAGEAMEKLGNLVLPALSTALGFAADALGAVSDAMDTVGKAAGSVVNAISSVIHPTVQLTDAEVKAALAFDRVGESSDKALKKDIPAGMDAAARATEHGVDDIIKNLRGVIQTYDDLKAANADVKKKIPQLEAALAHAHGDEAKRIRAEILLTEALAAKAYNAWLKIQKLGHTLTEHGRAEGGPVAAGEIYTVGERGPETLVMSPRGGGYVIPGGAGSPGGRDGTPAPSAAGVTIQGISEREILDMVDRGLFFRLRRAAPTAVTGG